MYKIQIGHAGEKNARPIQIPIASELAMWPNAVVNLHYTRPGATSPYVVSGTVADGCFNWTPSLTDTEYEGIGSAQVIFTDNTNAIIGKTDVFVVEVLISEGTAGTAPSGMQTWVDTLTALGATTTAKAAAAATSASNAANSATNAAISEQNAIAKATIAESKATAAAASATSAASSAAAASASESNAVTSAYGAATSASNAAASASSASASAAAAQSAAASIETGLDAKQDKLIAGTGISIAADGKTISSTGGGSGVQVATMTEARAYLYGE